MARPKKEKTLKPVAAPSNILTEDQMAALFFQHKDKIVALREKLASVNSDLRNAFKVAKAEGFTKKEIDFAISLEDDEDDKIQKARQRENQIARWLGVPLGTQAELALESEPDRRPIEERAAVEGKRDGMKGGSLNPPYAPGTPGYDEYCEAWHEGAAALFSIQNRNAAPLLRPESDEPDSDDDFDLAANGDFGDDTYRPGDEVDVETDEDETFEPPAFLSADTATAGAA